MKKISEMAPHTSVTLGRPKHPMSLPPERSWAVYVLSPMTGQHVKQHDYPLHWVEAMALAARMRQKRDGLTYEVSSWVEA